MHQPESPNDPFPDVDHRDPEAPEADFEEQHSAVNGDDDAGDDAPRDLPPDANPADVSEQSRTVAYDEDDYR